MSRGVRGSSRGGVHVEDEDPALRVRDRTAEQGRTAIIGWTSRSALAAAASGDTSSHARRDCPLSPFVSRIELVVDELGLHLSSNVVPISQSIVSVPLRVGTIGRQLAQCYSQEPSGRRSPERYDEGRFPSRSWMDRPQSKFSLSSTRKQDDAPVEDGRSEGRGSREDQDSGRRLGQAKLRNRPVSAQDQRSFRLERRLYQCSPERAKVHPPARRPLTVVAGSIVTGAVIGAADPALYIIMPLGYPAPPPRNHQ